MGDRIRHLSTRERVRSQRNQRCIKVNETFLCPADRGGKGDADRTMVWENSLGLLEHLAEPDCWDGLVAHGIPLKADAEFGTQA